MIQFLTGTLFGVLIGIIAICLCATAGEADTQMGLK